MKRCSDTLRLGAQLVRYNFSFILVPSWVNFSNRYRWSKIVHRGTWMGLTSYTVVHGWVTFPSKLVHGWVMGGGTSKFPEAHPYPDQSLVPPRAKEKPYHSAIFLTISPSNFLLLQHPSNIQFRTYICLQSDPSPPACPLSVIAIHVAPSIN